jgi:hypothetical protein
MARQSNEKKNCLILDDKNMNKSFKNDSKMDILLG